DLSQSDRARMAREGLVPIPAERGLALFDAATALGLPVVMPALLDPAALRRQAADGTIRPALRGLVRAAAKPKAGTGSAAGAASALADRLPGLSAQDRVKAVLDVVLGLT